VTLRAPSPSLPRAQHFVHRRVEPELLLLDQAHHGEPGDHLADRGGLEEGGRVGPGLEDLVGYPAEGDRADVRDTMLSGEGVQRLCAGGGRKGGGEGGRQNQAATHAAL
jgi:hypothetical protein